MRRAIKWLLPAVAVVVLLAAASPWIVATYWSTRSTNPVRRGIERASALGCFHCHGDLGRAGIPDPGGNEEDVPGWSGGTWMMYVQDEGEIRDFILNGSEGQAHGEAVFLPDHEEGSEMLMPAYKDILRGGDLDDLVAAFKVLSGMSRPAADSAARRGYDLARHWECFSCHGAAGSGGLSNPGSFTGFIPGWYGADFEEMVETREEFDGWIRHGSIERLLNNPLPAFFMRRQRISMPTYTDFETEDLDNLWAYMQWLAETEGGGGAPVSFP